VSIAAIILAAGRSRRMGTQKLLLPWHGKTVIQQVVGQVLAAGLNPVIVVTGGDSADDTAAIQQVLRSVPVTIANNPDRDAEMLSSVRCGLKAVPRECSGVLITPGDLPTISSGLIERLTQAIKQSNQGIVVPIYQGTRGHPTIIAAKYFDEVLSQYDGVGLRGLVTAHPHDIQEVVVSDATVIAEMNTPSDYQHHLELDRARHTSEREISD
jgi:molybdenum cofactor cytidylyltransferase